MMSSDGPVGKVQDLADGLMVCENRIADVVILLRTLRASMENRSMARFVGVTIGAERHPHLPLDEHGAVCGLPISLVGPSLESFLVDSMAGLRDRKSEMMKEMMEELASALTEARREAGDATA